jgi:hypothetical protein
VTTFKVAQLMQSSVLYLYSTKDDIQIDPEYQRIGEVWTEDKRQLLVDSILNGFDIPKLYFHELSGRVRGKKYKYAIIDGRQRLESVWSFIDGAYPLSKDFEYINDPLVKAAGLTYRELGEKYPKLKTLFDSTTLSVIVIQTADQDLIDEMFSRLNEAVPLNAAEKRNAFGGPMPKAIREIAELPFFKVRIRISSKRYQHRDLAAKLLYLASKEKVSDTKKVYLDEFVKRYKSKADGDVRPLIKKVKKVLSEMEGIFVYKDKLLRSSGVIVIYFLLFRDGMKEKWTERIKRALLARFEKVRTDNRAIAEKDITKATYDYLEFDRYSQTPNDAYAIRLRLNILKKFLDVLNE